MKVEELLKNVPYCLSSGQTNRPARQCIAPLASCRQQYIRAEVALSHACCTCHASGDCAIAFKAESIAIDDRVEMDMKCLILMQGMT
ncbi:hypothetical protein [Methylobacter sp.]|uniref:hypothetical protein n=1 Tax=Methylobacter sp. TaxID=2051955 RepID=UPI003DA3A0A8